MGSLILK